ncbi:MAG TPA: hypothetical protein VGR57_10140 [Ktedonobacterales bacterium]|nr:hypothetical protein [Ktedonobacterales bacterium]
MLGIGTRIKGYVIGLLAFVLLGALWTTALTHLSERPTATALLTDIGTELLNPLLVANGSGLAEGTYAGLQSAAQANPSQPLSIAFVKPTVLGREIAGKDFAAGSRVIYRHLAEAYYDGGPTNAFSLPSQLQQLVNVYTPFTQVPTNLPGVPNVPTTSPLPNLPIPQLPSFAEPIYAAVGISPTTLTKDGHAFEATWSGRFWLASLVLAALMALFGAGWDRLSNIGWSIFHSAWHITALLLLAAFLASRNPTQAAHYQGILGVVWGAFFPVYAVATATGLVVVGIAKFAPLLLKRGTAQPAGAAALPFGAGGPGAAGIPGMPPGMAGNPWQARATPPATPPVSPGDVYPPSSAPGAGNPPPSEGEG